ncbi:hypothetical protein BC834DRAFT_501728 [Gloeopeniophorella convolvens]|nr:hypothetical protein BC834DRAFT_501728 [Gloeopeniophorella convolvens]
MARAPRFHEPAKQEAACMSARARVLGPQVRMSMCQRITTGPASGKRPKESITAREAPGRTPARPPSDIRTVLITQKLRITQWIRCAASEPPLIYLMLCRPAQCLVAGCAPYVLAGTAFRDIVIVIVIVCVRACEGALFLDSVTGAASVSHHGSTFASAHFLIARCDTLICA